MREYLRTIHTRSHGHKKNFALAVSTLFTLAIFSVWSLFMFRPSEAEVVAIEPVSNDNALVIEDAATPFDTLGSGIGAVWAAVKDGLNTAKTGVEEADLDSKYEEMRNEALGQNQSENLNNQYGN